MGDTFEYLVYVVNIGWRNDKSRRTYVSFGDVCSEIESIEACSNKLFVGNDWNDYKNNCWNNIWNW